ncbi:hypothetical protein [Actinomadura parmotrematis]|uniref:hypothetical protein n=1 Tax=Actinomadura parmotrematis TaxID=2864039 RepID=UPI0027E2DE83|nr:hypothetical protein [Actinomadura parmotrematis]
MLDASPHLLVLHTADGERRLAMTGETSVRHGGLSGGLAALTAGCSVVVRQAPQGPAAERLWVEPARIAGTILACGRGTVEVEMGPHRGRATVVVPPAARGPVQVRHPRLEPGFLFDAICVRTPDGPRAVRPGTPQPAHRAGRPAAASRSAPAAELVQGTVTWFGDCVSAPGRGAAYPAVDPEGDAGGCAAAPRGCVPLPYLSLGSEIGVHNECGGHEGTVPVTECGCAAARWCDRCVECGTSPRGRLAELTPEAFVALGGDLEKGCFNAVLRPGAPAPPAGPARRRGWAW